MFIYIGNDLEDRLKILETESSLLRKYMNTIKWYMKLIICQTYIKTASSFYKQSMKIGNYHKITEWIDSLIGQSTVIQELDKKRPKLSNLNQPQNRRRYLNFENGFHLICNLKCK